LVLVNAAPTKRDDAISNVDREDEPAFWKEKRSDTISNVDREDEPAFWKVK